MTRWRIVLALGMLFTVGGAQLTPATAQSGVTVYIAPTDAITGEAITDGCFVLDGFSNEGCDENQDGVIRFEGVPAGDYTVVQTQAADGYLNVAAFGITVRAQFSEQTFGIPLTPIRTENETADVSVVPYDGSTGGGLTGACVIFEGGSLEGCDDNGDGKISFEGVLIGTYLLRETVPPPGYDLADARFVSVQQSGRTYYLEHTPDAQISPADSVDVALVTRHPQTGELLFGACYVILDASIEGCDENGDGQVDYEGVSPGSYTLHQTSAPDGFALVDDFDIQISQYDPEQSILVKQSNRQYAPGFRHVSVAIYDIETRQRVKGPEICVVLVDFSNEGCDLNSDGQIDFQDVPVGEYEIQATSLPVGYAVYFEENLIVVEETNPFSIANALLTLVAD